MKVLELRNVSKKIKNKQIIKDVSLDIEEGEILGLVGPNGAGKSTLIKCLLGLYKLDKGKVIINGFDIKNEFEKALENVGAIIENPEVYKYMNAKENMMLFKRMYEDVDEAYVDELLKLVKLDKRKKSKVSTYSLGMKQRLGIAIALLSKPKLLILDEPTNGLDPIGIKELRSLIKDLSIKTKTSVLISSHILSEIELVCDKIAIIDEGQIIEIKSKTEDKKDKVLDVEFIVNDQEKTVKLLNKIKIDAKIIQDKVIVSTIYSGLPIINKLLVENKIEIYEIIAKKPSLEDEFIRVTTGSKGQIK